MTHASTLLLRLEDQLKGIFPSGSLLLEIGTTRKETAVPEPEGDSTTKLARMCKRLGFHFITVDADPVRTEEIREDLAEVDPHFQAITKPGEDFIRDFEGPVHMVHLDAFDFWHPKHSEARKEAYRRMGTEITDENCWNMHLEFSRHIVGKMPKLGVLGFDDVFFDQDSLIRGKGVLAVPYLLNRGFKLMGKSPSALILQKE